MAKEPFRRLEGWVRGRRPGGGEAPIRWSGEWWSWTGPGLFSRRSESARWGVPRSTPYFFPLKVFNTVLGGAFTSRLMLNLREERGFTYGVRSRFSHRRGPGPFGISMAVATEVTAPAVGEALAELEGLLE